MRFEIDPHNPSPGYGELLPHPSGIVASDFAKWFFLFWAGALVVGVALPWCLKRAFANKDYLPILCLGAGFITSFGEPMLDLVGHLRWSENLHGPAFTNFGIPVPLLIPPCYALFMGLEAYWGYLIIQRGISVKNFFMLFAAIGASDALMEHPGVIMKVYEYYGKQPFEFYKFPFYWSFTNGAAIISISVALHYLWPLIKDDPKLRLLVLPVGIIVTTAVEFGTGFCVFLAINTDLPTAVQWVIGSGTLIVSCVWVRVLAELVCDDDSELEWTFWGLFKSRFMLPKQREAYIKGITKPKAHLPAHTPEREPQLARNLNPGTATS
jgi:hypothetical protein